VNRSRRVRLLLWCAATLCCIAMLLILVWAVKPLRQREIDAPANSFDQVKRAGPRGEAWLTPWPTEGDWQELDSKSYTRVHPAALELAVSQLRDRVFLQLDSSQLRYFAGDGWACQQTQRPFLVRGLLLNEGTGSFQVRVSPDARVHVHHGSLGRNSPPFTRQPLVICLSAQPLEVRVTSSMAE
jgi:hypothetical protein